MESRILEIFAARYPASAMRSGGRPLRLRSWEERFPDIVSSIEERLSFLEAMERLEASRIVNLHWKRRKFGEELESVELHDPAALHARLGLETPELLAHRLDARAVELAIGARERGDAESATWIERLASQPGMSPDILSDAARFLQTHPEEVASLPLRALSIRLYRNSKRLESILPFLAASASDAGRMRLPERSYPEVAIAGRADLLFADGSLWQLGGKTLSLSLETAEALVGIGSDRPFSALSVENKENFHAFARSASADWSFIVATGGRPNRAVRAILRLLASCGWTTRHAGDLDPDGIAILGEVHRICGALPLKMDAATFDRYAGYAKPLPESILHRLGHLDADVVDLPGIAELVRRIAESGMSVEQEIIEY